MRIKCLLLLPALSFDSRRRREIKARVSAAAPSGMSNSFNTSSRLTRGDGGGDGGVNSAWLVSMNGAGVRSNVGVGGVRGMALAVAAGHVKKGHGCGPGNFSQ